MYGKRVLIPISFQKRIFKEFHAGHSGISRMKSLMSYVHRIKMDKDIEKLVKSCKGCAMASKVPSIKFSSWPKTDRPLTRLHLMASLMAIIVYLWWTDFRSSQGFWNAKKKKKKKKTTETVISFQHELFTRFAVADFIVSDNKTQFTSKEFKEFCRTYVFEHVTIAPYQPRSNSQTERFVDTFKRALKKAKGTPTDTAIQQFLKSCCVTPNKNAP